MAVSSKHDDVENLNQNARENAANSTNTGDSQSRKRQLVPRESEQEISEQDTSDGACRASSKRSKLSTPTEVDGGAAVPFAFEEFVLAV